MIDKQKLLQWIEDKRYVYAIDDADKYAVDYDTLIAQGCLKMLSMLGMAVSSGELKQEPGE